MPNIGWVETNTRAHNLRKIREAQSDTEVEFALYGRLACFIHLDHPPVSLYLQVPHTGGA